MLAAVGAVAGCDGGGATAGDDAAAATDATRVDGDAADAFAPATNCMPAREYDFLRDAVDLFGGGLTTCAHSQDGTLRCWGGPSWFPLGCAPSGDGPVDPFLVLSAAPLAFAAPLAGMSDAAEVRPSPNAIDPLDVSQVEPMACARLRDGTLRCWGEGVLGDGWNWDGTQLIPPEAFLPTAIAGVADAVQLALSFATVYVVRSDGTVLCWGDNSDGQCGASPTTTTVRRPTPVPGVDGVVQVGAGAFHACALRRDGTVWCWGENSSGELGRPATTTPGTPAAVPGLSGVVQLAVGDAHSCARLQGGTVRCWGQGSDGELGYGATPHAEPTPVVVPGVLDAIDLAAGAFHSCVVRGDHTVACWGLNVNGQLGAGGSEHCITSGIGGGSLAPCATAPQAVSGVADVIKLSLGNQHSCALSAFGRVWCWGRNTYGELGRGDAGGTQLAPDLVWR